MAVRSPADPALLGAVPHAAQTPGADRVVDAQAGGSVELPSGRFLSDAAYIRDGADLIVGGPDGVRIVIRGYFSAEPPPTLVTPEGGMMPPSLVESFARSSTPGQYAQLGPGAGAQPIGQVQDIQGTVFAIRADGTRVQLSAGDPVFQGDVIETGGGNAAISLLFVDDTTFSLGGDARLALDELVYNPVTQEGSSQFSILKGVFVFASGQIAKGDNTKMTVMTPVATIGIRGTEVAGKVGAPGEQSQFTVIDGTISVTTGGGTVVMNQGNQTTTVTSFSAPPADPVTMSAADLASSYREVSSVAPRAFQRMQDTQQQNQQQNQQQQGDG